MIESTNTIPVYEIDGSDVPAGAPTPTIKVVSHWNSSDRVTLVVEGKKFTVLGKDLTTAVHNAQNTARH